MFVTIDCQSISDLHYRLKKFNIKCNGVEKFLQVCVEALDNFTLINAHMKRRGLRNKYLQSMSECNKIDHQTERKYAFSVGDF